MSAADVLELVEVDPSKHERYLWPLTARGPRGDRARALRVREVEVLPTDQGQSVVVTVKDTHLGEYQITLYAPYVIESSAGDTPPENLDEFSLATLELGAWGIEPGNAGGLVLTATQTTISWTNRVTVGLSGLKIDSVVRPTPRGMCKLWLNDVYGFRWYHF